MVNATIRHKILPPLREVKDKSGALYMVLPFYVALDRDKATLAYPVMICFSRSRDSDFARLEIKPLEKGNLSARRLYGKPVESPAGVYALPLSKLCHATLASTSPRSDCIPVLAVNASNPNYPWAKVAVVYAFNVTTDDECNRIDSVYYARLWLKPEGGSSNANSCTSVELHLVIAGMEGSFRQEFNAKVDTVKDAAGILRADIRQPCTYKNTSTYLEVWPPIPIVIRGSRTTRVKSYPLYMRLLTSLQEGVGDLVEKLVGANLLIEKARKPPSLQLYMPSSVVLSSHASSYSNKSILILGNAAEMIHPNVLVVRSESIDYEELYRKIKGSIVKSFNLALKCAEKAGGLNNTIRLIIKSTLEKFYPHSTLHRERGETLAQLDVLEAPGSDNSELIDPKLTVKILLNQATILAATGKSKVSRAAATVRFRKLLDVPPPVTELLPGTAVLKESNIPPREAHLAYLYMSLNLNRLTQYGALAIEALRLLGNTCSQLTDLEKDNAAAVLAWLALISLHAALKGLQKLAIAVEPASAAGALVGSIMGLHALSHAQMREVAARLGVSRRDVREYIVLTAPTSSRDHIVSLASRGLDNEAIGVIIDGGLEIRGDIDSYKAWILTISTQEGSGYLAQGPMRSNPLSVTANFTNFKKHVYAQGYDRCYRSWISRSRPLRVRLISYLSRLGSNPFVSALNRARKDVLSQVSPHHRTSPPEHTLYLPIETVQNLLEKRLKVTLKHHTTPGLGFLVGQAVRADVPECFDACFNCVMDEFCFISVSPLQQLMISKEAAKILSESHGST